MQVAPAQDRLSIIFRVFCLVLPPLSVFAQRGVVALLLVVAGSACFVVWRAERRLPVPDRAITMAFGVLLLWCAVASFWGFDVVRSLILALRIGVIFAAGLLLSAIACRLDHGIRKKLGDWLLAGISISLVLTAVELAFGYPFFEVVTGLSSDRADLDYRLNRGATAMAMLVWPAVALLWHRGVVVGAMILLTVVAVMLSLMTSGAAVVGAIAGGFTALVAVTHRKAGRVVIVSVMVLALAGMSLAAQEIYRRDWQNAEWLSGSAQHRVDIWNNTARLIEQKPLTGWGFDAARAFTKMDPSRDRGSWQMMPLHPHNAPLQILVELGAVGAVIVLVLLWLLAGRLEGLPKSSRICSQALFVSTLAIAGTAYGLWQNQWLAMMFSAALLIPLTSPALAKNPAPGGAAEGSSPGAPP